MKPGFSILQVGVCALAILCAALVPLAQCQPVDIAAALGSVDLEGGDDIDVTQLAFGAVDGPIATGAVSVDALVTGGPAEGTIDGTATSLSSRGGSAIGAFAADGLFDSAEGDAASFTNSLTGVAAATGFFEGTGPNFEAATIATAVGTDPNCDSIPFCSDCVVAGEGVSCTACVAGYYLSSGSCPSCSAAIDNCAACALGSAVQGLLCSACDGGLTPSDDGQSCVEDEEEEEEEEDEDEDDEDEDDECDPSSIDDCAACEEDDDDVKECTECKDGYYLDKDNASDERDACLECPRSPRICATCEVNAIDEVECVTCEDPEATINGDFRCERCDDLDPQCDHCEIENGELVCSGCIPGFGQNNAGNCNPCVVPNCMACDVNNQGGNAECEECEDGFEPNGAGNACIQIDR